MFFGICYAYHCELVGHPRVTIRDVISAIHRSAMSNPHGKYNEAFILYLADHPVVAHPVAP